MNTPVEDWSCVGPGGRHGDCSAVSSEVQAGSGRSVNSLVYTGPRLDGGVASS